MNQSQLLILQNVFCLEKKRKREKNKLKYTRLTISREWLTSLSIRKTYRLFSVGNLTFFLSIKEACISQIVMNYQSGCLSALLELGVINGLKLLLWSHSSWSFPAFILISIILPLEQTENRCGFNMYACSFGSSVDMTSAFARLQLQDRMLHVRGTAMELLLIQKRMGRLFLCKLESPVLL